MEEYNPILIISIIVLIPVFTVISAMSLLKVLAKKDIKDKNKKD